MPEYIPKIIVVDASILFSFFKKDSFRRGLIEELSNFGCKLISPEYALTEVENNKERIKKFGKINELAFTFIFSLLNGKIEYFQENIYAQYLPEVNKFSPHEGNVIKDDPYFALALSLNCPIWSDEKSFKKQSKVKVYSTSELLNLFGLKQ